LTSNLPSTEQHIIYVLLCMMVGVLTQDYMYSLPEGRLDYKIKQRR